MTFDNAFALVCDVLVVALFVWVCVLERRRARREQSATPTPLDELLDPVDAHAATTPVEGRATPPARCYADPVTDQTDELMAEIYTHLGDR